MLRNVGLLGESGEMRILGFLGMSALITLGFIGGFILLIIPGLIFMARWSVAPSMFIARGQKATEAMGSSWSATKGNEFAIILALLAMSILFYALAFMPAYLAGGQSMLTVVIGQLGSSIASAIQGAMGVAVYGLLASREAVTSTFE